MKCIYCGKDIDSSMEKCPNCNAINADYERVVISDPKTIDELKEWYKAMNLPDENVTRFFIGTDYKEPKAFGIYRDNKSGEFVVYKNKDTGERAIRYQGSDEAYAVNELFLKLKSEILNQKRNNNNKTKKDYLNWFKNSIIFVIVSIILIYLGIKFLALFRGHDLVYIITCIVIYYFVCIFALAGWDARDKLSRKSVAGLIAIFTSIFLIFGYVGINNGYYKINDNYYYNSYGSWYYYDSGTWINSSKPSYTGDLSDYVDSYDYKGNSSNYSDVHQSNVWEVDHASSSSDSDYSWDSSDSWDSGSTDWGSDW